LTRRTLWALPLLLATPALAGPGTPSVPVRRPTTLAAALDAVAAAEERLHALVRTAKEDPRVVKIARYMALKTAEEFANPRRDVKVADLALWMADAKAPLLVRERARDALKSVTHRSQDPDLQISEGRNSKRITFSLKTLVPLLQDADETTRAFAADVLESYWHSSDPDIQRYNPRPGSEKTWSAAVSAYRRYLAR
jgi:hypothetical protein